MPGVPKEDRERAEPEEAHQPAERRPPEREPRAGGHDAREIATVALRLEALADVALHDPDPRQRLLGRDGAAGDRVLHLGADALERPPEDDRDDDQRGRQHEHDHEQDRVEQEQDDDGADQPDERREQRRGRLGQHRPDQRHVTREARHELAHAVAAVEVERERHQALEQLVAQPRDHPLPDDAEQVRLDEAPERLGDEQDHETGHQPVEPGGVAAGHHRGHEARDDERHHQREAGPEDQARDGERERREVRAQVAQQAPPWDPADHADPAGDLRPVDGRGQGRERVHPQIMPRGSAAPGRSRRDPPRPSSSPTRPRGPRGGRWG